jgi:hypothetical protein
LLVLSNKEEGPADSAISMAASMIDINRSISLVEEDAILLPVPNNNKSSIDDDVVVNDGGGGSEGNVVKNDAASASELW